MEVTRLISSEQVQSPFQSKGTRLQKRLALINLLEVQRGYDNPTFLTFLSGNMASMNESHPVLQERVLLIVVTSEMKISLGGIFFSWSATSLARLGRQWTALTSVDYCVVLRNIFVVAADSSYPAESTAGCMAKNLLLASINLHTSHSLV